MDLPFIFIDMVLHIDKYLPGIIAGYGFWTYLIIFAIIFCETGLVVLPYLPGDSLLFVAGTLAGAGYLNIEILLITLFAAAVLGDTVNYWIGHTTGLKVLEKKYSFVRTEHLDRTREYFTQYGGITIVIARFIPFIRTFAPFLAGVGRMSYRWFLTYNIIGAFLWVCAFTLAGFFFGSLPIVKENFSLIVYAIIGVSLLAVASIVINVIRHPGMQKSSTESEKKE
ncbi:VTT domain-containing protein [Methanoregula sp.]|uniref:VTT domain-containing protein n=1 Tax=Methanoregula sp. TaxID=2052170 RepID=UPI00236D4CDC|nr:VTT domain-containing protein [Methanoregula sp.]MDD1686140.1 VTT domain-containing protein [Methanoregula sp.]